MKKELAKTYDPSSFEDRIYKFWEDNGYFTAKRDETKKPYTIVIPPPNITGQLHLGHALDETIQDILIRYRRSQGYAALWVPGTDHASIATEAKIVEKMKEEGISKEELGREGFLERAWEWKDQYASRIVGQLKKLGSSCDWSRQRFTLDEGCSKAVQNVFIRLYEKGLIYQGERIINWCPCCKTTISDAEVEYEEQQGFFWHLRYPFEDGSGYLELATTRPETLLGDTAVAVNPNDDRYKSAVGKKLILPLVGRVIEVIADDYVDMEFGTGVVKITPAHDPNDFEVGLRHKLPIVNVMTEDAHINENGGIYEGMERYEARKRIVEDLEKGGFLVKVEPHSHNVGQCYRCHQTVEPRVSKQWFVKMEPLAKPAIEAVKKGDTKFVPERFDKIYFNWMENIKDWCISRQLWWGHRIPAYYCDSCGETVISAEMPSSCPKCGGHSLRQDEDTLDTWFSSALWPFSTLGWPEQTEDLKFFYPTDTLVTGYDIIFFWVARMIFSALEYTGEVPFKSVYIHGLVRDSQGRKMSKSLGNGVDPLQTIAEYGADALRLALVTGNSPGNDMRYSDEKVKSARNFANKLWNAARFILMNLEDINEIKLPEGLQIEDKWVLSNLNRLIGEVTENLDKFEFGIAVQKLYDFIWDILCDWYIELVKSRLQAGGEASRNAQQVLLYVMSQSLLLLHPFMPFITEEIWSSLPTEGASIMEARFPIYSKSLEFADEEAQFSLVMSAIKGIRNTRTEMNVAPSRKAAVIIETEHKDIFESSKAFFERLSSASSVEICSKYENSEKAVRIVTQGANIYLPLDELVDKQKETERLSREKASCQKEIDILSGKLSNSGFVEKAPEKVVNEIREKLSRAQELMKKIDEAISAL